MENKEQARKISSEKIETAVTKRKYRTPQLQRFGALTKLTQGTGTMNIDSVAGRRLN